MRQDTCLSEFETRLGALLPQEYRDFLAAHTDKLLEPELKFDVANGPSGIVSYLYTACDLLKRSIENRLGDPSQGMMAIGSDQMGGYVYMCVSDAAFGRIYCRVAYKGGEYFALAASFTEFNEICTAIKD
jgi:hypothetical protein